MVRLQPVDTHRGRYCCSPKVRRDDRDDHIRFKSRQAQDSIIAYRNALDTSNK